MNVKEYKNEMEPLKGLNYNMQRSFFNLNGRMHLSSCEVNRSDDWSLNRSNDWLFHN